MMSEPKTTNKVEVVGEETELSINQYKVERKIGEGAFGKVYLVTDTIKNQQYVTFFNYCYHSFIYILISLF